MLIRASASFVVSRGRRFDRPDVPHRSEIELRFVRLLHAADLRANALTRSHLRPVRGPRYHPDGGDHPCRRGVARATLPRSMGTSAFEHATAVGSVRSRTSRISQVVTLV